MTLKNDAKFEERLALGSKNDMTNLINFNANSGKPELTFCLKNNKRNLVNFNLSSGKSEDFHFVGISLLNAFNV